jgi:hypothetical protein
LVAILFAIVAISLFLLTTAFGDLAFGNSTGPDDGFAGNPPDFFNCTVCHDTFDPNSGDGDLALSGLPGTFVPGTTYSLVVQLSDPGQERWGFEVTVLDGANNQAGDLVVTDVVNTQLSDNALLFPDYLKHTWEGTQWPTPNGPVVWTFDWVAPDLPSVTFYLAGNAANGSEDPSGDYIYTRQYTISQAPTATEVSSWGQIKALYRR